MRVAPPLELQDSAAAAASESAARDLRDPFAPAHAWFAARGMTPEAVDQATPEAWAELEAAFFAQTSHPLEALLNAIARHAPSRAGKAS